VSPAQHHSNGDNSVPVTRSDGQPCRLVDETLKCWRSHYDNMLNHAAASPCPELTMASTSATPDPNISDDVPTIGEVRRAIKKLHNGRAAGPDNIQLELLKYAEEPDTAALHDLFMQVWKTGKVPAEWRDRIIVSLYKGKGQRTDCGNYRPISLLSVPGKVFANVLLVRLQPLLTARRRPQQSGFTAGRSTIDAILALRLLSELHREFSQPLHVAYIDIKAAFDSVDRVALWKALRSTAAPPFLIQLIADLHQGTTSRVRVGGRLSQRFRTTSGVRQGCVLAPALFCVAVDWIISRCANTMGISVGSSTFTDLDYADDAVLFTDCQSKWPDILSHFDTAAQTLGLHTSWQKTKVQNVGYGPAPSPVNVQGQPVEVTDQFTYLGSAISSSGRSAPEIHRRIGLASSIMG